MLGARRLWLVVVALAVLLTGCRGRVDVNLRVRPDGSGRVQVLVSLDRDAVARAGSLQKVLRLGDLRKAGWRVDGPGPTATVVKQAPAVAAEHEVAGISGPGGEAVALTHDFANVRQGNELLASLSGTDGPLRSVRLSRSTGFRSTKVRLDGTVDLHRGLDTFGDAALTKALGGRTVSQVARTVAGGRALAPDDVTVHLNVTGDGFHFSPQAGAGVTSAELGDAARSFRLQATQAHTAALLWTVLAVVLALAALVLFALGRLPGRPQPPPASRRRQLRSSDRGWELVTRRTRRGG